MEIFDRFSITVLLVGFLVAVSSGAAQTPTAPLQEKWTSDFHLQTCRFSSSGRLMYFILEPGYQVVLEGEEGDVPVKLLVTVLPETQVIDGVETRVVEEREWHNGQVIEVSRNFFAICKQNGSLFYFGEDVDIYKNGKVVGHEGAWRAGEKNYRAGLMMSALPLLGSRYYQEIAPNVAMDRAEIISDAVKVETPAGKFENCLKVEETTPLEPGVKEYKWYAPGIGLVQDGSLKLTYYGEQE